MNSIFDELEVELLIPEGTPLPLSKCLDDIFEEFGDGSQQFLGIRTGIEKLDEATLGLDGLIVLSGKAGGGKTSLAIQLTFGAIEKDKVPILFYSLEMSRRQLVARLLSQITGIDQKKIYRGGRRTEQTFEYSLTQAEHEKLQQGKERLRRTGDRYYIVDRADGEISFNKLKEQINLLKTLYQTEKVLVVIDHLQVFSLNPENKGEKYVDQISKETALINGFKDVQSITNSAVLLISQENKAAYNKGSIMAVKGSVDIVYLADVVMQIVSEDEESKDSDKLEDAIAVFGAVKDVQLVINKNRYGETKVIPLRFDGKTSKFRE